MRVYLRKIQKTLKISWIRKILGRNEEMKSYLKIGPIMAKRNLKNKRKSSRHQLERT